MKISLSEILIIGCAVLLTLQINSCFTKVRKPESMVRNEVEIEHLKEDRVKDSLMWVERLSFKDSLIAILQNKFNEIENKKQPLYDAVKKTKSVVVDYDREQLRREFASGR